MHLFRHISQKASGIHKVFPAFFVSSAEKSVCAIRTPLLCGIALSIPCVSKLKRNSGTPRTVYFQFGILCYPSWCDLCRPAMWLSCEEVLRCCLREGQRNTGWSISVHGMEGSQFVAPGVRGFGLQRLAAWFKDREARSIGAAEAIATVSPMNPASYRNIRASGFRVDARREMYGGLDRLVMKKDF